MLANPAFLTALFDKLGIGVFVLDAEQTIVLWNRWLAVASGQAAESVIGRRLTEVFPNLADTRLVGAIQTVLQRGLPAVLSQSLHPSPLDLQRTSYNDQAKIRMQQSILLTPIRDGGQLYCLAQVQDVTAAVQKEDLLREQAEELRRHASLDGLTGIANRRQFDAVLDEEWQRARRQQHGIGLLLISVDDFRQFNARFGHLRADHALRELAHLLEQQLGGLEDLLARFEGKQFAILLPHAEPSTCQALAEQVLQALRQRAMPHPDSPHGILTVSIGVACSTPQGDDDASVLLQAAQGALQQARAAGKNQLASTTHSR